jgi:hypothetical protein
VNHFLVQYGDGLFLADAPLYATEYGAFAKLMSLADATRAASSVPGSRVVVFQHAGSYSAEELWDSEQFQAVI